MHVSISGRVVVILVASRAAAGLQTCTGRSPLLRVARRGDGGVASSSAAASEEDLVIAQQWEYGEEGAWESEDGDAWRVGASGHAPDDASVGAALETLQKNASPTRP